MRCTTSTLQLLPLRNAESVLLVNHDQAKLVIDNLGFEQRVRTDNNICGARLNRCQNITTLGFFLCADHIHHRYRHLSYKLHDAVIVLLSKYLGWSHQHCLIAVIDRIEHAEQCDNRLPRSNITLKQSIHGLARRHVFDDLMDHAPLRSSKLVGE